jgi:hypothetical protein
LLAVLLRLLEHPEPMVRLQVLQRLVVLPVADPQQLLLPVLVQKLGSPLPDERQAAAHAVFTNCKAQDVGLIGEAFSKVLPQRRALLTAVVALQSMVASDRRRLTPVARSVLATLKRDPLMAELRIGLAIDTLSWQELAREFEELSTGDSFHADVLAVARSGLGNWTGRTDNADLEHLETELAQKQDARLRRLALAALVVEASLPEGWNEARLGRLRRYREDPSPLVAAAAQLTLPAEEEQPPQQEQAHDRTM